MPEDWSDTRGWGSPPEGFEADSIRDQMAALQRRDQMAEALDRQRDQLIKSMHVDRTGWTRQQWIDDARTLMGHPDGAITSLVNGHVLALLDESQQHQGSTT